MHMGGRRNGEENSQIFNQGTRLGHFIRYIVTRSPKAGSRSSSTVTYSIRSRRKLAGYVAFDAASALRMMEHLYTDASFAPVWRRWRRSWQAPRRHLVFVVGNHDIEMALPVVEDSIRAAAGRGQQRRPRRASCFRLTAQDTGAWSAASGVFCSHGNELDSWNWVDYSALGQLANAIERGPARRRLAVEAECRHAARDRRDERGQAAAAVRRSPQAGGRARSRAY